MNNNYNSKLIDHSRNLRTNMTKEERHLWYDFLKSLPVTVHRQKVIGPYIVDFYIASANLVIELDGSQHFEPENMEYDQVRTAFLENSGLKVIRIPNNAVKENFSGVCEYLLRLMNEES